MLLSLNGPKLLLASLPNIGSSPPILPPNPPVTADEEGSDPLRICKCVIVDWPLTVNSYCLSVFFSSWSAFAIWLLNRPLSMIYLIRSWSQFSK